jgi:hypothetical protein
LAPQHLQQERKDQIAAECGTVATDLEREKGLNSSLKASATALEKMREHKEDMVAALEASRGGEAPALDPAAQQVRRHRALPAGFALACRLTASKVYHPTRQYME